MNKNLLFASLSTLAASVGMYCASSDTSGFNPQGTLPDMPAAGEMSTVPGCTTSTSYTAMQSPAAMLVALDKSNFMAQGNNWQAAGQAIVQVFDQDVFNSMSLGLLAAPSGQVAAPQCAQALGYPTVSCLVPTFPQVDLALAGANKSTASSGVRHDIKSWLANNSPDTDPASGSPLFVAIQTSLSDLQSWPQQGKRILMVVTDGNIDCCSLSNRPGCFSDGFCTDWENPNNIINMLSAANKDPNTPVDTFIIGVPGSNTYDPSGGMYAPYHMRLALSAMAYAGSPNNVPQNCTGRIFTPSGGDPQVSCHFDLSQGTLNANTVAAAIAQARGQVVGCTYELPQPNGAVVDTNMVNVSYVIGTTTTNLTRRADPNNTCTTTGCWDYTQDGKVQLIGKACSDVQSASSANVQITVGCFTVSG